MKVIFLDIDGVLNCQDTFIKRYEKKKITGYYELEIDIDMVKRLAKIVEETNSLIVLSSSWRIFLSMKWCFKGFFKRNRVSGVVERIQFINL